jgi:adenine C2-methylase RlmN of 23S rRNA A2503 and tRNA A37
MKFNFPSKAITTLCLLSLIICFAGCSVKATATNGGNNNVGLSGKIPI